MIEQYLGSLEAIGIDLRKHDIKFEEDNWEAPTLGAWGIGWQVMLDGLEITQFTYFQQCGGIDLDLVPAELTYGLERLTAFLQVKDSVYDIDWTNGFTYGDVRYQDELQYSVYNFEMADIPTLWKLFDLHEGEAARLLKLYDPKSPDKKRFPLLPTYDQVLKCSNLFNTLDARGAISVTERVGVIQRVRKLAVGVAQAWVDQQQAAARRWRNELASSARNRHRRDSRLDDSRARWKTCGCCSKSWRSRTNRSRWTPRRAAWCCAPRDCRSARRTAKSASWGRRNRRPRRRWPDSRASRA